MSPDKKLFLKIGITQTIIVPIVYIIFGLFNNRPITESLLSSVGTVVACWISIGLFINGSKLPKK